MDDRKRHEAGMKIRREVLGDAHVDRAKSQENEFTSDFQDFITRYAWGEVWARPGLDKPTRALITIGMMIALNRGEELRLHLRGAINNGERTSRFVKFYSIPRFIAVSRQQILHFISRMSFCKKPVGSFGLSNLYRRFRQYVGHPLHGTQI